jgi:hypothetical protein
MNTVVPPSDPLRRAPSSLTADGAGFALPRLLRMSALALAVVGVFSFGAIIYSAYQSDDSIHPGDVPLIAAEDGDLRAQPDDAGGMQVANRDSTIYGMIDGSSREGGAIERLVPQPEAPRVISTPEGMPEPMRPDGRPALTADEIHRMNQERRAVGSADAAGHAVNTLTTAAASLPQGAASGQTSTMTAERLEPLPEAQAAVSAPVIEQSDAYITQAPAAKPAPVKDMSNKVANTKPAAGAAAIAATGNKMVQLGAVRSEADAKAEWQRLAKKYPSLLGSLGFSVQKADLGAKGVFWRVRGGPVSPDAGADICGKLKAAGQSCIVVAR